METTFGIQTRYDAINLGLTDTYQRAFLSNVRSDIVGEASVAVYAQSAVHWSDWLRTTMDVRGDYYDAKVNSIFDVNNSGTARAAIAIHHGGRPVEQNGAFSGCRHKHAQQ
jgi:outer membrane receptor protein involved in Fe transport